MDKPHESQTRPRRGQLQHLKIAILISEGTYGTPADEFLNADRLAGLIVDKIDSG
jgi:hypothetical protein